MSRKRNQARRAIRIRAPTPPPTAPAITGTLVLEFCEVDWVDVEFAPEAVLVLVSPITVSDPPPEAWIVVETPAVIVAATVDDAGLTHV